MNVLDFELVSSFRRMVGAPCLHYRGNDGRTGADGSSGHLEGLAPLAPCVFAEILLEKLFLTNVFTRNEFR